VAPEVITFTLETITPDLAGKLLVSQRQGAERQDGVVRAYRDAMAGGLWILNGMPIIVSRSGVLLDGVQRLLACIDAGVAFPSFVARGVEDEAVGTIDLHRRRTFAGVIGSAGGQQARARMAVVLSLTRYDHMALGSATPPAPSWAWMEAVMRANPTLNSALETSRLLAGSPLPEPVRSAFIHMGFAVGRQKTERVLAALAHPERVARGEPGAMLRAQLDRAAEMKTLSPNMALAMAVQALNAILKGGTPARLEDWSEADAMPRLIGYEGLVQPAPEADPDLPVPEAQFELIGPDLAGRYLASGAPERRLIRTHVSALARDISEGRWMQNAQPICFAASGQLMNGQHRLVAVIASGGTIEVPVVRGLPEAAAATYDIQARRSPVGTDETASFGDQALAAAMANLLWRQELKADAPREKRPSTAEVRQILRDHPRLLALRGLARRLVAFGRASVLGYGAYVIERDRADLAGAFFAALESDAGQSPADPMVALRETLHRMRREHTSQEAQLAALLAGWERFKQGPGDAPPSSLPATASADSAEQRRRLRHQRLANDFAALALGEDDMQALLREAARVAADGAATQYSAVLEHERTTDMLLLRAGIGWRPGVVGRVRLPRGQSSPAGRCLATGEPILSNDLGLEDRFATPPLLADHGVMRVADVPVPGRDRLFGVLEVAEQRPGSFSEADLRFLRSLAGTLGLAIERLRGAALLAEMRSEIGQRSRAGLQLAHYMVAFEAREAKGDAAQPLLELSARRILTLAVAVGRSHAGHVAHGVEMHGYIAELVEALRDGRFGFPAIRPVVSEAGDPVFWPPSRAQLLGIVLGELLADAMLDNMGSGSAGAATPLRIRFTAQEDVARLELEAEREPSRRLRQGAASQADDAPEAEETRPEGVDPGAGLRMVSALMRERGGTLWVQREHGAWRVVVAFPADGTASQSPINGS